jgi:hypothetical protein
MHLAMVTRPTLRDFRPARAAQRVDPRQHAPVRFEGQSSVLDSPAIESARMYGAMWPAAQRDQTESPYQGDLQPHRLRSG